MKLIINIFIATTLLYASSGQCDLFSFTPKNKISTKTTEDSISNKYACKGNVDKDLLNVIFNDLVYLSKQNNIEPPQKSLCQYIISKMLMAGKNIELYMVEYFVKKSDMETDPSDYSRVVQFKVVRGKIGKYYFLLDNHPPYQSFRYCIKLDGQMVDEKEC